jgi:hypothetical protein
MGHSPKVNWLSAQGFTHPTDILLPFVEGHLVRKGIELS